VAAGACGGGALGGGRGDGDAAYARVAVAQAAARARSALRAAATRGAAAATARSARKFGSLAASASSSGLQVPVGGTDRGGRWAFIPPPICPGARHQPGLMRVISPGWCLAPGQMGGGIFGIPRALTPFVTAGGMGQDKWAKICARRSGAGCFNYFFHTFQI